MREREIIEYRGFGLGHLFLAALTGAAAGAAAAYLTSPAKGEDNRRRLKELVGDSREGVTQLPVALRKATEAARDAFNETLDESVRAD